jgi:hypothetical protein
MTDNSEKNLDERLTQLKVARAELYYAITLTADDDLKVIFGTCSHWAGWSDPEERIELRQARLVYPTYVMLWEGCGEPYCIVHDADEVTIFLLAGGHALVEKSLAEQLFPELLKPEASIKDGVAGFKSSTMFPKSAFKRAPSPKVRMQVFKRDNRRCRICGRKPDDHTDLELHVHHIRPWSKGGVTDIANLITLCHTCHKGLEPHEDYSLFNYLAPDTANAEEAPRHRFLKEVANYRKVGFFDERSFPQT